MNCKDAVERLMDLRGDASSDPILAGHVENCPSCGKEAVDIGRLFQVLRDAGEPSDAEAASLTRRVVARLGEEEERRNRWTLRPAWGIAAAAAVVVLIIWTAVPGGKSGPATQVSFQPASSGRPAGDPPRQPVENEGAETGGVLLALAEEPDRNGWSDEDIREARVTLAAADADLLARDMVDPADVYRVFALMSEEDKAGLLSALSERRSSLGNPGRVVMAS